MEIIKRKITLYTLFIIYIAALFFCCFYNFSNIDLSDIPKSFLGIELDKYIHFTMFFPYPIITGLIIINFVKSKQIKKYRYIIVALSGYILAAATEEMQELLTTYRSGDTNDFIADLIGITCGALVLHYISKFIK